MKCAFLAIFTLAAAVAVSPAHAVPPARAAAPRSATSASPTSPSAVSSPPSLVARAKSVLAAKDYLGFRIFIKKAYYRTLTYGEWYRLKSLINTHAMNAGFDLVQLWSARNPPAKAAFDTNIEKADQLMIAGRFAEAFVQYQANADYLRKMKAYLVGRKTTDARERLQELDARYPFLLHSMGRALYGAGRYEDALETYGWIKPSYPRFRQVLFEKMWAGFRSGRVEVALGAIASQRSAYFSKYLSPESYLIQTYVYRKLCRLQEVEQVLSEMKAYEAAIQHGNASDWAAGDTDSLVLHRLASMPDPLITPADISPAEREKERAGIRRILQQAFERQKPRLLLDLKTAMAYAHLAGITDPSTTLKPVREFKSREELLAQDLEFWPADSAEEWIDEVGTHIFMGDSLCAAH